METSDEKKSVYQFMSHMGFSQIEIDLYLKLLELGSASITELHSKTNIPRTTVHENIERLIDKGIVTQTMQNSRRKVIAEDPRQLQTLLMNQQVEFQNKIDIYSRLSDELGNMVNSINSLVSSKSTQSQSFLVKYFQGIEGFLDVHQRTLQSSQDLLFFSNMDEWKKVFSDDFAYKYYVPERIKKKIFARTLAIDSDIARDIRSKDKLYFREMRFLPQGITFKPTLIISDKEISIMTATKPYTAILIYNSSVAEMFRAMFNILWEVSK